MQNTHTLSGLTAVPTFDASGVACLGVPLAGALGAGKLALIDADGLRKLEAAGASALSLTGDGQGREYVVFRRAEDRRLTPAARIIAGAPVGFRVEHLSGDRLDLRRQNLRVRRYAKAGGGRRSLAESTRW